MPTLKLVTTVIMLLLTFSNHVVAFNDYEDGSLFLNQDQVEFSVSLVSGIYYLIVDNSGFTGPTVKNSATADITWWVAAAPGGDILTGSITVPRADFDWYNFTVPADFNNIQLTFSVVLSSLSSFFITDDSGRLEFLSQQSDWNKETVNDAFGSFFFVIVVFFVAAIGAYLVYNRQRKRVAKKIYEQNLMNLKQGTNIITREQKFCSYCAAVIDKRVMICPECGSQQKK